MNHHPLRTLQAFLNNPQPTIEEAMEVFTPLAVGAYDDIHIAALLTHIPPVAKPSQTLPALPRPF